MEEASSARQTLSHSNDDLYSRRVDTNRNNDFALMVALHGMHIAFIGLLIALIQLKFQNNIDSPFKTDSSFMTISIFALASYGFSVGFKITAVLDTAYTNQSKSESILTHATIIFGGISSISLLSVLIKDQLCCLVYIIWVVSLATAAYYTFKENMHFGYKWIVRAIFRIINMLTKHLFTNFIWFRSIEQQHSIGTTTSV